MKKIIFGIALLALTSNAYAADLVSALDKANAKVVETQGTVDALKANIQAQQDELQAKKDEATTSKNAKVEEVSDKAETLKTNLGNLKNSLTIEK